MKYLLRLVCMFTDHLPRVWRDDHGSAMKCCDRCWKVLDISSQLVASRPRPGEGLDT